MTVEKKPKSPTPSADAQSAGTQIPDAAGKTTRTLSGLTKNTINGTETSALYGDRAAYDQYGKLTKDERANYQRALSQIVGLYPRGKAPTRFDGVFREEDFKALGDVMAYADLSNEITDANSEGYVKSIIKLRDNPAVAASYFNYKVPPGPNYSLTPLAMAATDFSSAYRSVLGSDPTAKQISVYHSAINKVESAQKGQFSAAQRDAIAISFIQKEAAALVAKASNPEDKVALNKISTGNLGGFINAIRSTYLDNGISFTEDKVRKQAVAALKDKASYDNILSDIHSKAAIFVPAFADGINAGKSARDVLSPYISMYSKLYGVPEDQVKIDDVSFAGAGDKPMMPKDFNTALTMDPKFKSTDTYKNNVSSGLQNLANKMGIVV